MRYLSVDFYRGLTVAFMILVNTPGTWEHVYAPLQHAAWHGCTPTDLVFPSFMFIIGVSMWFAFAKYDRRWSAEVGKKILRRTALLFLIGLILNNFPMVWKNWDTWRIMGVMQRLALGYGLGSVLVLTLSRRVLMAVSASMLLLYWVLLLVFSMSGGDPYSMETNAVLRLDRWLFTDAHLWRGEYMPFDPEGVLSTLPAVVTVILGWLCGSLYTQMEHQKDLLVRDLLIWGIVLSCVGLVWDMVFPINKKIWTSSYVLYAGGLSMIFLALSVWIIDVRGWRRGAGFFQAFGSNPLFAYILSEALIMILFAIKWTDTAGATLSAQQWLYQHLFVPIEGKAFSSFLFALAYTLFCWVWCRWLFVRGVFVRV